MNDPNDVQELSSSNKGTSSARDLESNDDALAEVFISYRVHPDERVARALKSLLASSIEPPPTVFVSGEDLRPAAIGFKGQILSAIQRARAFVAIITPESKDREWVFFEAGAAWGRSQLYAPLLVGTSRDDLGSTIADYHATKASDREQMEKLVSMIAEAVGGELKARFGTRFASFDRALAQHLKQPTESSIDTTMAAASYKRNESSATTPRDRAVALRIAERHEEADRAFAELEAQATDPDAKANLRIDSIVHGSEEGVDLLRRLETIPNEYKQVPSYQVWVGILEPRHSIAIPMLRSVCKEPAERALAMQVLSRRLTHSGQLAEAAAVLTEALADDERSVRAGAAEVWLELRPADPELLRFLVLTVGLRATRTPQIVRAMTNLAIDARWHPVAISCAETSRERSENGTTLNDLGRAYHNAGLPSLAYDVYTQSVDHGVDVAKCNIASLCAHAVVPAAGLSVLKTHVGPFQSSERAFPHMVRAQIEEAIGVEQRRATEMATNGGLLTRLLADVIEVALRTSPADLAPKYSRDGLWTTESASPLEFSLSADSVPVTRTLRFTRTIAMLNVWLAWEADRMVGVYRVALDRALVGVAFQGLGVDDPGAKVATFDPVAVDPLPAG